MNLENIAALIIVGIVMLFSVSVFIDTCFRDDDDSGGPRAA